LSANIIVAATDTNVINALNTILIDRNYSILIENSNTSALLKVLDQNIELLIVDLDMSKNTGLDFIQIVRKTRPRLPIIVLSENPTIETIQEILNMGVYYWTFKPVLPKIVLSENPTIETIQEILNMGVYYWTFKPVLPKEINKFIDAIEVMKKKSP